MKVEIYSFNKIMELINNGFPKNTAIISFCNPKNVKRSDEIKTYFTKASKRVFFITIPDIDIEILENYGYTYETYLDNADELAKFIYDSKNDGFDIICQCDYGQSRSAACAAAILQHFESRGIDIFSDYKYYPNQLVYHKVIEGLKKFKEKNHPTD